jgi:hypothetical protein
MQLRYLGDSHDYIKFALLLHLVKAVKEALQLFADQSPIFKKGKGRVETIA